MSFFLFLSFYINFFPSYKIPFPFLFSAFIHSLYIPLDLSFGKQRKWRKMIFNNTIMGKLWTVRWAEHVDCMRYMRNKCGHFSWEPDGIRPPRGPRYWVECNIETDPKEIRLEDVDWIRVV